MPNKTDVFIAKNLTCTFGHGKKKWVKAIDDIALHRRPGNSIASGRVRCGKSVLPK